MVLSPSAACIYGDQYPSPDSLPKGVNGASCHVEPLASGVAVTTVPGNDGSEVEASESLAVSVAVITGTSVGVSIEASPGITVGVAAGMSAALADSGVSVGLIGTCVGARETLSGVRVGWTATIFGSCVGCSDQGASALRNPNRYSNCCA